MSTARVESTPQLWNPARAGALMDTVLVHLDKLRRLRCGLTGHTMVRHFEPQRMALRCLNCGEQTHGWTIYSPLTPSRSH